MSSVQAIDTLIHEARIHQIRGDRETAIKCYMTVIPTISSLLEKSNPEQRAYLETTLSNVQKELELVRSLEETQKPEEPVQPVYERVPSVAASSTGDSALTDSISTIASVPEEANPSASAPKSSFKEKWGRGMNKCRVFFKRPHATPSPSEKKTIFHPKKRSFFNAIWDGIAVFARCTSIIFTQFFCMWKGVFTRTKPTQ